MTRLRPPRAGAAGAAAAGSAVFVVRFRVVLVTGACSPLSAVFFFAAGVARFLAGVAGVVSSVFVFFRGATCDSSLVGTCRNVKRKTSRYEAAVVLRPGLA